MFDVFDKEVGRDVWNKRLKSQEFQKKKNRHSRSYFPGYFWLRKIRVSFILWKFFRQRRTTHFYKWLCSLSNRWSCRLSIVHKFFSKAFIKIVSTLVIHLFSFCSLISENYWIHSRQRVLLLHDLVSLLYFLYFLYFTSVYDAPSLNFYWLEKSRIT